MREKFERKPVRIGGSVGFTIPAYLVKSAKVELGKKYEVTVSDEVAEDGGLQ